MRLVERTEEGTVEFLWMWAPVWIGQNAVLKKELEAHIAPLVVGKPLDDGALDYAHDAVLDFIEKKFPTIPGLRDYLDAIKFVDDSSAS